MTSNPNVIDRAFQIARDGQCNSVADIRERLIREGYEQVGAHLGGPTIRRELYRLIRVGRQLGTDPA